MSNYLNTFRELLAIGLKFPLRVVQSLNLRNFKTLINALKNEPPHQIIKNFYLLLTSNQVAKQTEPVWQYVIYPHQTILWEKATAIQFQKGKIIAECTSIYYFAKQLKATAWAISMIGIEQVTLFDEKKQLGVAQLSNEKLNIAPFQGQLRYFFEFSKSIELASTTLYFEIIDKKGQKRKIEVVLKESYGHLPLEQQYPIFLQKNRLTPSIIEKIENECSHFVYQPKISIIVPIYNTPINYINKCVESVVNQIYSNWELCLYDDASTQEETKNSLKKWAARDKRIQLAFGKQNQHISGASNCAIQMATGEWIGLLDHDDELTIDALYEVVKAININKNIELIYSNEDKIEPDGRLSTPHFKTNFNLDMLLSMNYIGHFVVIKKEVGDKIGWFRKGYEGSQDYDLFLRIINQTRQIHHIPKVLYHWREAPMSVAKQLDNKNYAQKTAIKALESYLIHHNIKAKVLPGLFPSTYRIQRTIIYSKKVSIIIPFKDKVELLKKCIQSILEKTIYPNFEILLISNNSQEKSIFNYANDLTRRYSNIYFYEYNIPFNYSKINNWAVKKTTGDYLLFLNNDTEAIDKGWLAAMVEHIQREKVGAVGAKLLYEDDTVQHAGVLIGIRGVPLHHYRFAASNEAGYFNRLAIIQNYSACTAACLLVKKDVFEKVKGFDEENLKISFNDIDLCLKIRELGYSIVFTPYTKLYHYESKSRGLNTTLAKQKRFWEELNFLRSKWKTIFEDGDPFYNHNLSPNREDFRLRI